MSSVPSITHDRVELKFKVSAAHASAFARGLAAHVSEHRFEGEGANRLPRARHYVTTVYFDTQSLDLYRAVRSSDDNLKVRAREYYDVHPELLELATHANQVVRYSPVLWVEIKGKHHGRTYKRRIGIPKTDVSAFFERGEVSEAMHALQVQKRGSKADDVIAELLDLRTRYPEPLRPSCLVNYRRTAFQNAAGNVRITLDQRLACFAPTLDLLLQPKPLLREYLGRPRYEEPAFILEVKLTGDMPGWLDQLMKTAHAQQYAFSKFVTASESVYETAQTGQTP
ncbi:MAG TPA: polyphosphate polymerase domain-containing protein [Polyangiales bacterium]|nr:polyphosphate polymerase domain-containing protein [Polyangiales bacterium]